MMQLQGLDRRRMGGRERGPRTTWQPALGREGSGCAKMSKISAEWRSLATLLRGVADALRPGGSREARQRAPRLQRLLRQRRWGTPQRTCHERGIAEWTRGIAWEHTRHARYMEALADAAESNAATTAQYDELLAKKKWASWLTEGPARSLGRHHRMSRCQGDGYLATCRKRTTPPGGFSRRSSL